MKIQIDVSDFYLDEDSNLEEGLKNYVTDEAIASIFGKIKDKVAIEIKQVVEAHVLANLSSKIAEAMQDGKIKNRSNNTLVTIKEYVEDCLISNPSSGWVSFDKTIREVSKTFCDEMRRRYDLTFASNIVANLVNNKMIKDEVVKLAIGEKNA